MTKNTDKPVHILLYETDQDLIPIALAASESLNVILDTCQSSAEIVSLLEKDGYDALVLNTGIQDVSCFEIIQSARKKAPIPIAALMKPSGDVSHFRQLKEEYNVDYILEKPVYQDQLERLFVALCKSQEDNSKVSQSKEQKLREYYKSTICDKIELLTELVNGVKYHWDEPSLTALKEKVHKYGGSAGAYGFLAASKICKELEKEIQQRVNSNGQEIKFHWLPNLETFLREIKFCFQFSDERFDEPDNLPEYRNSLFVVDSDDKFIEMLRKENSQVGLALTTETNPAEAKKRLASSDFNPRAVLVADSYPGYALNGIHLIQEGRKKTSSLPTLYGMAMSEENLDLRVKAVKEGFRYTFSKPISPRTVLETFSAAISPPMLESFRVLILDDDWDVCQFMSEALSEIGVSPRAIHRPESLFQTLEEFKPHLLLLDVILPQHDGISLLKALRADPLYSQLDIIIATSFEDDSIKQGASNGNVIDVIYKPLKKPVFQAQIHELLNRRMMKNYTDPVAKRVGLKTLRELEENLELLLSRDGTEKSFLALLEVDRFDDFVLEKGKQQANRFLAFLGNFLFESSNQMIRPFYVGTSRFAIIMEKTTEAAVREKIRKVILAARRNSDTDIHFSAGIVKVTGAHSSGQEILHLAEEVLDSVESDNTSSFLKLGTETGSHAGPARNHIMYVDPDPALQKMLSTALGQHNLQVAAYSHGEEALEALKKTRKEQYPDLIIAERSLPDMDGLVLLDRLQTLSVDSPFYFLTNYASDQDIAEGLKHGAADYITKPFNLSIFTQKILREVFEKSTV